MLPRCVSSKSRVAEASFRKKEARARESVIAMKDYEQ